MGQTQLLQAKIIAAPSHQDDRSTGLYVKVPGIQHRSASASQSLASHIWRMECGTMPSDFSSREHDGSIRHVRCRSEEKHIDCPVCAAAETGSCVHGISGSEELRSCAAEQ